MNVQTEPTFEDLLNGAVASLDKCAQAYHGNIGKIDGKLGEFDNRFEPKKVAGKGNISCKAKSASPFDVGTFDVEDLNKGGVISGSDINSGVMVSDLDGAHFDLVLPYAVIIGDSISEGHPALHGRLHGDGVSGFTHNYSSQPGQLSYHLSRGLRMPFINHGVGSQTTQNVRDRWSRDVLHQSYDAGDSRGTDTMSFAGQLPHLVWLHCGINDVFLDVPVESIKANFLYFAKSCRDHGIHLIVDNIGAHSAYSEARMGVAKELNDWLDGEFASQYSEVQVIDYLGWSVGADGEYTSLKAGMFADQVHPNKAGYENFAHFAVTHVKLPVFLKSIVLGSAIDGPSQFSRITRFDFNGASYKIRGEEAAIEVGDLLSVDDPVVRLDVLETEVVTNTNADLTDQYTGFATVYGRFSNVYEPPLYGINDVTDSLVLVGGCLVLEGELAVGYASTGIASLDDSNLASTGDMKITFVKPVKFMVVTMVGLSDSAWQFVPVHHSVHNVVSGSTEWTVRLRKNSDGAPSLALADHDYQIIAFGDA